MGVDQEMEEAYDCLVVAVSCHWDQIHSYMVDLGPLRLSDRSWDPRGSHGGGGPCLMDMVCGCCMAEVILAERSYIMFVV